MEQQHTPAPWYAQYGAILVGVNAPRAIADVDRDTDEGDANARLIAAAPDLLAALEEAGSLLDALSDGYADIGADTRVISRRKAARAAIAKARGLGQHVDTIA